MNPTISAAEGAANTPAFRDTVYAWFHRLPLEDFGNRIPNITCEVSYNLTDGRFQMNSEPRTGLRCVLCLSDGYQ